MLNQYLQWHSEVRPLELYYYKLYKPKRKLLLKGHEQIYSPWPSTFTLAVKSAGLLQEKHFSIPVFYDISRQKKSLLSLFFFFWFYLWLEQDKYFGLVCTAATDELLILHKSLQHSHVQKQPFNTLKDLWWWGSVESLWISILPVVDTVSLDCLSLEE